MTWVDPVALGERPCVIVLNVEAPKMVGTLISRSHGMGNLRATVTRLAEVFLTTSHRLGFCVGGVIAASFGEAAHSTFLRLVGLQYVRFWPLRLLP